MPDTERLWEAPGHATARWHNVFIQIRTGEVTVEVLEHYETAARLMRAQQTGPRGALFIKGAGSPPMVGRVAVLQREMIAGLESDRLLHACGVIEGDGLSDVAQRVVLRVALGTKRFVIRSSVAAGALWVVSSIGSPYEPRALVDFVESLRPAR